MLLYILYLHCWRFVYHVIRSRLLNIEKKKKLPIDIRHLIHKCVIHCMCTYLPSILDTHPLETWSMRDMSHGLAPECASSTIFCRVESGNGRPLTYTPPSWLIPLWPAAEQPNRAAELWTIAAAAAVILQWSESSGKYHNSILLIQSVQYTHHNKSIVTKLYWQYWYKCFCINYNIYDEYVYYVQYR